MRLLSGVLPATPPPPHATFYKPDRARPAACEAARETGVALVFFCDTFSFQVFDEQCSHVSSHLPPGSCLQFLSRIGFKAILLLVDFSSSVAINNARSRAFRVRKSICAQEKVPTNSHEYALGGARTRKTDL